VSQSNANLSVKHRPKTLADVLGQGWVIQNLAAFAESPYPVAFLFEGETGTGKTSAALALAHDLGCSLDDAELGGVHEIPSGEQTADSVRAILRRLSIRPLCGSGWKVLVVNEADRMSVAAETVWLDGLEQLPPRSVVIFTTNHAGRLSQRFLDRCERFTFESRMDVLRQDLETLVSRVWHAETGRDDCPSLESLGQIADADGQASFRRVLQLLAPCVRSGRLPERAASAAPRLDPPVNGTKQSLTERIYDLLKRSTKPLHRAEVHQQVGEKIPLKAVSATLSGLRTRGLVSSPERGLWVSV
jgi:replication-associated recombination protein RarA